MLVTQEQLLHFAEVLTLLAFFCGLAGAVAWQGLCLVMGALTGLWLRWEERRMRIVHARMRHVHGPLVLPGESSWARRTLARALRIRHAKQAHG